jgi:uncharacterized coiled-coil protein SlyX
MAPEKKTKFQFLTQDELPVYVAQLSRTVKRQAEDIVALNQNLEVISARLDALTEAVSKRVGL